jgi:hypothetical protein
MNPMPAGQVHVKLTVPSDMIEELKGELAEAGASDIEAPEFKAGFAIIPVAIAAVLAVSALGDLIMRIRAKRQCRQIIDARGDEVKTKVDCDIKDGRIVVIARSGDEVEIADVPDGVDIAKVIEAAMAGGGDDVKKAAGV